MALGFAACQPGLEAVRVHWVIGKGRDHRPFEYQTYDNSGGSRAGQIYGASTANGICIALSNLLIGVSALELGYRVATANVVAPDVRAFSGLK